MVEMDKSKEKLIEEFRAYFEKFGKYEKIMSGAKIFSNILGLENNNPTPELTSDKFDTYLRLSEKQVQVHCFK